jgi:hypothetical protein
MPARGKTSQQLGRSGSLDLGVQVVAPNEGETNLHSHPGLDSAWVVLDGEAIFYREGDEVIATLSRNEQPANDWLRRDRSGAAVRHGSGGWPTCSERSARRRCSLPASPSR